MSAPSITAQIAALNDEFRSTLMIPQLEPSKLKGMGFWTIGISGLSAEAKIEIVTMVRDFDQFTEDNDPWGQHDFGSIHHPEVGKVFWKIDYYTDERLVEGSANPDDPDKCYRVLTIMLAEEY